MKIGIVCPYSFDVPGGVQAHVRDLTKELLSRGHQVSVLAPTSDSQPPPWMRPAGRSVAVPYNGSVARLSFGPRAAVRTQKWLNEGNFDVLHVHEPFAPSLGLLALLKARCPIVATFHTAMDYSLIRRLSRPLLQTLLEKISGRIAVSQEARRTLMENEGGDAVVIPNGVFISAFMQAEPCSSWKGTSKAPTIVFLGRLEEPRKGLLILAQAAQEVILKYPNARFLIAGSGGNRHAKKYFGEAVKNVDWLGEINDAQKTSLLRGASIYVAPQTGGESFGIVLVEAMAAGSLVVASNISAFDSVLGNGKYGILFKAGSSTALAQAIIDGIENEKERSFLIGEARRDIAKYDWQTVATQIEEVYKIAVKTGDCAANLDGKN